MMNANREYLASHGPAPAGELPEAVGMTGPLELFRVHGGRNGGIEAVDQVTGVYHLTEHDPKEILEAFLEANPALLASGAVEEFRRELADYGPEWTTALDTAFQRGQTATPAD